VAAIIRVADEVEMAEIANHAPIGIGASVWSADPERALTVGQRLRCGQVYVNAPVDEDPAIPAGGVGPSGFGRLLGEAGCREFTSTKALIFG
jgi:succinate-semialdehyde dehydrogenase/glutarate-semialdehyde dehydrogenase